MSDRAESAEEVYPEPGKVEVGRILHGLGVGQRFTFRFEWEDVTHEKTVTVTESKERPDHSGMRPDNAPAPYDIRAVTEAGVEYIFTTATAHGEVVPTPLAAVEHIERKKPDDEKATQLSYSTVTRVEVLGS